jgi:bleomycin hydrolase
LEISIDNSEESYGWQSGVAEYTEPYKLSSVDSIRQAQFDNFQTTDDHAMQVAGIASDSTGLEYIFCKNSWGANFTPYGGNVYISLPYFKLKTLSYLVHKDVVPTSILKKIVFCK